MTHNQIAILAYGGAAFCFFGMLYAGLGLLRAVHRQKPKGHSSEPANG